ncbi:hypothetical protein A1Q2_02946 [Trichosporon asahii var. asahii CBS 8904]|uniref:Uncharacterized protein n=1 Tax=Trichosporon asahii var. asahii (strain CBS 8904) TaxID=1220162 RepID=K1VQ37_TRIAC|nr:hypothetical protein A1Q2_02946 [Trichosporon asahii var. asahii CBS 8904]
MPPYPPVAPRAGLMAGAALRAFVGPRSALEISPASGSLSAITCRRVHHMQERHHMHRAHHMPVDSTVERSIVLVRGEPHMSIWHDPRSEMFANHRKIGQSVAMDGALAT